MQLTDIGVLLSAYVLGAVPFSVLISKYIFKNDVRKHGSGNPGATNTLRTFGVGAGLLVLLMDMAKGVGAVYLGSLMTEWYNWSSEEQMALAGGMAIIGHILSPFLNFKGGKGVATTVGVVVALHPVFALVIIGVFLMILLVSRFVSLASMAAAVCYAILIIAYRNESLILILFSIAVMLIILVKHQANIKRLANQEESKFKLKKQKA